MAVNDKDLHPDDARIAAIYRAAAAEGPPASVDAAVLRNARGALAARSDEARTAWWMPWRIPFAFAAVAVLSVSLVLVIEREGGEPLKLEAPPREAPAVAAAPEPSTTVQAQPDALAQAPQSSAKPVPEREGAGRRDEARTGDRNQAFAGRRSEERARETPPAPALLEKKLEAPESPGPLRDAPPAAADAKALGSAAPATRGPESEAAANVQAPAAPAAAPMAVPPPPAAPPVPERKPAMPAPPRQMAPEPAAKPSAAPAPAPAPAPAAKPLAAQRRAATSDAMSPAVAALVAELDQRPPADWLARIAVLRREGRTSDADALVAEFRRRFPDEPAPPAER